MTFCDFFVTFLRLFGTFNFFGVTFLYIRLFGDFLETVTFSDFLGIFGTCLGLFWYFFGSLVDFLGSFFNFSGLFCENLKKKIFSFNFLFFLLFEDFFWTFFTVETFFKTFKFFFTFSWNIINARIVRSIQLCQFTNVHNVVDSSGFGGKLVI